LQRSGGEWQICYGPQNEPQQSDSGETSWVFHRAVPNAELNAVHELCSTFSSAAQLILSLLVSTVCAVGYTWAFLRLTSMRAVVLSYRVSVGLGLCAAGSTIALSVLVMQDNETQFQWFAVASFAVLALVSETGIAMLWHSQRHRFSQVEDTVSNRLWRGAVAPLLAVLAGVPAVAVYLVQAKAERLDLIIEHVWSALSFGVLAPLLPVAAVFCRTYHVDSMMNEQALEPTLATVLETQPEPEPEPEPEAPALSVTRPASPERLSLSRRVRGGEFSQFSAGMWDEGGDHESLEGDPNAATTVDMRELLEGQQIYRADLFLWAQRGYARLSALLPFAFWLAYMANEMQIFLCALQKQSRRRQAGGGPRAGVSVDGVRALNPVVVALNIASLVALFLAVLWFPAPQEYSPFVFFGLLWSVVVSVMVLVVTVALVWSLSEPQRQAVLRDDSARRTLRTNMLRESFSIRLRNRSRVRASVQWLTSWHGQTLLSTINHMFAIGLFIYGIIQYTPEIPEAQRTQIVLWLAAGVGFSGLGLLVSAASIVQRKWPTLKCLPVDDSFRLACVLKIALVMTKSTIVFLLATIDGKTASFKHWELIVSVVSYVSLIVLALVTIAFAVCKVWSKDSLLVAAGVSHPRMFIVQYGVSFLCSKCATVFFMLQGHVPDLAGCSPDSVTFPATTTEMNKGDMQHLISAKAIDCTLCFPHGVGDASPELCRPFYDEAELTEPQYVCTSSCTRLFFSGGGGSTADQEAGGGLAALVPARPTLVVFVLAPLLWLPFAVYANNEVAQLIDGLWFTHTNGQRSGSMRIGLSTTSQGYYVIAPLIHAVTVVCVGIVLMFMCTSGGQGYTVARPPQLGVGIHIEGGGEVVDKAAGEAAAVALDKACPAVTVGTVLLSSIMLLRVLAEIAVSWQEGRRSASDDVDGLDAPLLGDDDTVALASEGEGDSSGGGGENDPRAQRDASVANEGGGGVAPSTEGGDGVATAVGVALALLAGAE
jgi:hypothetical protein